MYLTIPELDVVTIEHTNKCYGKCPECPRNTPDGKLNPCLKLKELTVDDYRKIGDESFYENLPLISLTGCYGDATAASNLHDVLRYLMSVDARVIIQTNGDFNPPEYYEEIAHIFNGKDRCAVEFAIDGLEDTNHLYRKNTDFQRIINNARAFINAGGNARVNVILFDHIIHQKDAIIQRAKDEGFKSIVLKTHLRHLPVNKYFNHNMYKRLYYEDDDFGELLDKYGTYENYINQSKITCIFKTTGQLYIDHQLNVWPCTCMGGNHFLFLDENHILKKQALGIIKRYGNGFNSLKTNTLEEIFNHPFYKNDLEESWSNTMNDKNYKHAICAKACGDFKRMSGCAMENKEKIIF